MTPKRTTPEAIARHALAACTYATFDATYEASPRGYTRAIRDAGIPDDIYGMDWMRQLWVDSYVNPTRVTMEARR